MRPRPRLAEPVPPVDFDEGVPVARAAMELGCDESTVRRMLDNGDLEGWRVRASRDARGGVRVSRASIEAYKRGMAIEPRPARGAKTKPQGGGTGAGHKSAVAYLKNLGLLSRG